MEGDQSHEHELEATSTTLARGKQSFSSNSTDDNILEILSFGEQLSSSNFNHFPNNGQTVDSNQTLIKEDEFNPSFDDYHNLRNYQFLEIIGSGSLGTVHKALFLPSGREMAIKIINFTDFEEVIKDEVKKNFENEIEILEQIKRIATFKLTFEFFAGFIQEECGYIVMELISGFSLEELIYSESNISPEQQKYYLASMVLGLEELQTNLGCIHRDIKPENVMILANVLLMLIEGKLIFVDFGCAKTLEKSERMAEIIGTCEYFSPSRFKCNYGFEADIWSFGVLAYELMMKDLPFTYNGIEYSEESEKFYRISNLLKKRKSISFHEIKENSVFQTFIQLVFNSIINSEKEVLSLIKESSYFEAFPWKLLKENKLEPPQFFTEMEVKNIKSDYLMKFKI